ncbi:MAG: DUF6456 domain-containing protein [Rhizobiaceae bacterium]
MAFLAGGRASAREAASPGKVLLDCGERGIISVAADQLGALARQGLIARQNGALELTQDGRAWLARANGDNPFQDQHRELATVTILLPGGPGQAQVNINESPLAQLARRRGKSGVPFLSTAEFRAGERLRSDYTRGNIMPRLGANWVASVSTGKRGGDVGSMVELTDAALAARQRVERAVDAVGPELAGILIDVCCFLKGIETVEAERQWPVRSAKVVLKTALAALSRHYEPQVRNARMTVHWGTADYRPSIS